MKKALKITFILLFISLPIILSNEGINVLEKIFLVNLINYQERESFCYFLILINFTTLLIYVLGERKYLHLSVTFWAFSWLYILNYVQTKELFSGILFSYSLISFISLLSWISCELILKNKTKLISENAGDKEDEYKFKLKEDIPIQNSEEDEFKRAETAKSLIKLIGNTTTSTSFGIAILGPWGSGKTSFMNLISKLSDRKFYEVKFNPWGIDEELLIRNMMREIQGNIEDTAIRNKLNQFIKLLEADNSNSIFKFFSFIFSSLIEPISIENIKKEIGDKLTKKKLVIYLDDVDRLSRGELLTLFQFIRNTFNIPNVFFIIGMDNDYVSEQLKDFNFFRYSEKIFQLKLELPVINKNVIANTIRHYFDDLLLSQVSKENLSLVYSFNYKEIGDDFEIIELNDIFKLLQTKRDVNLIYNKFVLLYNTLKEDVSIPILLLLTIIQIKSPNNYNYIKSNRIKLIRHWELRKKNPTMATIHGEDVTDLEKDFKDNPNLNLSFINVLIRINESLEDKFNFFSNRNFGNYFQYSFEDSFVSEELYENLYNQNIEDAYKLIDKIGDVSKIGELINVHIIPDLHKYDCHNRNAVILFYVYCWVKVGLNFFSFEDVLVDVITKCNLNITDVYNEIISQSCYDDFDKARITAGLFYPLFTEKFYSYALKYLDNVRYFENENLKYLFSWYPHLYISNLQEEKQRASNDSANEFLSKAIEIDLIGFFCNFIINYQFNYQNNTYSLYAGKEIENFVLKNLKKIRENLYELNSVIAKELLDFLAIYFDLGNPNRNLTFGFVHVSFEFKEFVPFQIRDNPRIRFRVDLEL